MIVYNISIKVDKTIEKDWVEWQTKEHIPEVMSSGQFTDHKFYRLLEQDDAEATTYIVQYFSASPENYNYYMEHVAPLRHQEALDKWGNKFIAFTTVMQRVD